VTKITHIVVHYSATFADQNLTVKDIDKMHRDRGWSMVGYHWVIRRDGKVEQGRPETMVGAHVGGQNTGKIGICCIGGLDRATGPNKGVDNRTPQQIESMIQLIRECLKRYPGAKVVGHRDLAPTQCPGFDVQTWWAKVQKTKAPIPTPVPAGAPAKTGVISEDTHHVVERGETWWSIAAMHGLALGDLLLINSAEPGDVLLTGRKLALKRKPQSVEFPGTPKPVASKPQSLDTSGNNNRGIGIAGAVAAAIAAIAAYFGGIWP
jgi:N-acetylmuramoyl-L-alanine amidase